MAGRGSDDVWVFAYGSLMWMPGFESVESRPALLRGYHRAFCMHSHHAWGTRERPGLVLGLLPGGACRGHALRVAAGQEAAVLAYLDVREGAAYRRKLLPVGLGGGTVAAFTYVADRDHALFAGRLSLERAAALVRQGVGHRGASREYLRNTVCHLDEFGIRDGALHRLLTAVEAPAARIP